jgi:1,4-alpha-glucan branching enzyme
VFKLFRVTGAGVPSEQKAPYDPLRAARALSDDVDDFVSVVHRRLREIEAQDGRAGLVVAAYDTELFGHWWHEGVDWLATLLTRLPEAGVEVSTMSKAIEAMPADRATYPERGSWGLGKDLAVWDGDNVRGMLDGQLWAQDALLKAIAERHGDGLGRDAWLDELAEAVLLASASDWPFMVSHDSSARYARSRLDSALGEVDRLLSRRHPSGVDPELRPFGHVDSRLISGA